MPVELTCRGVNAQPYAAALRDDALALLQILALEDCELSLMLVGDGAIRRLNRKFREKDQATDVLSFPQMERAGQARQIRRAAIADGPPIPLGDIVISIDTARRQARELGLGTSARIRTLLIHGMLHLQGYDHERSAAAARRMFAREHELAELMQDLRGAGPRPRSKRAHAAADPRWSPAAMPERASAAAKKTSDKRT